MTVEIQKPDIQALIQQRMESGQFESIEDVIGDALRSAPPVTKRTLEPTQTLDEMFAEIRGLADDLDFSRNPSTGRPVEF